MKWKLLAVLAALTGLLCGCAAPKTAETTLAPEPPAPEEVSLHVFCFQAGKADAFLFWNEAGAVLIDAGESGFGKTILAKLQELGIDRLEALILTHFDKDHVGGAKKLLESLEIGTIYQSNCPKDGSAYEKYIAAVEALDLQPVTVRAETGFALGQAEFRIDPPDQETYPEDPSNNSSLIVTVHCGETKLLFTGDAENLRLAELLTRDPGHCDLIKLPHHGSWYALLSAVLGVTTPEYAVITSSEEEPEDVQTVNLLETLGIQTLLTREGPIQIDVWPDGLTVIQN